VKNAKQARVTLDAMIQALGGTAWLNMKNQMRQGHVAASSTASPPAAPPPNWEYHQWPDHDRFEYTTHRDVVQFYMGRTGSEVTYRGKAPLPEEQVDDFLRRPRTTPSRPPSSCGSTTPRPSSSNEGQRLAERHLADQVTLISASNEAVTSSPTCRPTCPLRRTFEWREPALQGQEPRRRGVRRLHLMNGFPPHSPSPASRTTT